MGTVTTPPDDDRIPGWREKLAASPFAAAVFEEALARGRLHVREQIFIRVQAVHQLAVNFDLRARNATLAHDEIAPGRLPSKPLGRSVI